MSMGEKYISREGFEAAQKELDELKKKRYEVAAEIGKAREFGDISENAEYHAAKERQGFIEKQIAELEDKLSRVEIMDDNDAPSDRVLLGTTVTLDSDGLEMTYTMVSALEADPDAGKISIDSPIGSGALGHKEGDVITVELPKGPMEFTIKKITR
jgi:transcription elongation factor GreA